jgi:hypothetical protein
MASWQYDLEQAEARVARHGGGTLDHYRDYYRRRPGDTSRPITDADIRRWFEADQAELYRCQRFQAEAAARRKHWSKLPPVSHGYTRIPDRADGTRMVSCDDCGTEITSLGIGYHRQNTGH